jgi:hypothetical protein
MDGFVATFTNRLDPKGAGVGAGALPGGSGA